MKSTLLPLYYPILQRSYSDYYVCASLYILFTLSYCILLKTNTFCGEHIYYIFLQTKDINLLTLIDFVMFSL